MGRSDSLADVAQRYGRAIGARPREIEACLAEDALEITRRIQAASRAFPVRATPSFLVARAADATRISVIAGWAGAAAFRRQLEGARVS